MEREAKISQLETELQESSEELSSIKSEMEMKDCILAGFDKELVALIEEFLEEKEDLKA